MARSGTRSTTWIPLDVRFPRHRKVVLLTRDVRYRHIEALCHCRELDTGGHISQAEVDELMRDLSPAKRRAAVDALLDAGLWRMNGGGYVMHDWEDWNQSLDDQRAKDAARKRDERERKKRGQEADVE